MSKQVYFVVAVSFDEDGSNATASLDEDRALAVFDGSDVWNDTTNEWETIGQDDNEFLLTEAQALLKSKLA